MTPLFHAFAARDARVYMPGAPFVVSGLILVAVFPAFLALNPRRTRRA
jgi:hypothetical protein